MKKKKGKSKPSSMDSSPQVDMVEVMTPRPSIAQLEALLNQEEEVEIEILPNGEVRSKGKAGDTGDKKPLTYRENLGGEYAVT